ncbi:MAG: alpha/beta hydrolase [Eubacteriales bacterium]|nr:alpha/beta hydrolase [Eubacteriales bacterium]
METSGKKKISIGRIIGDILEFIWTLFKLAVIVSVVTIVVGFLLSRTMMIRGRNGERQATKNMKASSVVLTNKSQEDENVKAWLKKAKRQKVTMTADDGYVLVSRKIVTDKKSDKWVVVLHGYNGSMQDIYDIAMHYSKEGYNILMPDMRACGESEGSFLGMGWLDRLDLINWIDVILEENPSAQIVVHGVDIGGEAAVMMTGESLKSSVKAVVAEGAYSSVWDVMRQEYEIRFEGKPVFPFLHMMNPVTKVWGGYMLTEADAIKQVQKSNVPILLIHGAKDTYSTTDMMSRFDTAIASQHQIVELSTAMHEDGRYAEPETYYKKTFEFVNSYVK